MPANLAKVHLQNVVDYPSHTLSLRRDKGAAKGISTELPGAKSIYICDSELFKQLDGDAARASGEGGAPDGAAKPQGYVLLPGANSGTLKPAKGKEEPPAKYNLSVEQLPQTRLVHLSSSGSAEPAPAFGLKTLPAEQLSASCPDKDSPARLQTLPREAKGAGGPSEAGEGAKAAVMTKSETVSTLSMSSLEVGPSVHSALVRALA